MLTAAVGSKNLSAIRVYPAKRGGRPKGADPRSECSRKPWLAEGLSERTYRRRKAVIAAQLPHDAHERAWRALDFFERQDLARAARKLRIAAAPSKPFGREIEILVRARSR